MDNDSLLFANDVNLGENSEIENDKKVISLTNIKETGYYFDEDGILRYIKDNSPFPFKSLLIPLFKVRYDIFRTLTAKYVREVLHAVGCISQILYTNELPNGIRLLHTKDFMKHTGPLFVIIQGGGVTRAGVWSSRLLMHSSGGINMASQLPQVKRAISLKYAVLIINSSERITHPPSSKHELSPEEIIHCVWKNIIGQCASNKILIWAHMYGGTAFLYPLQPVPDLKSCRYNSLSSNCKLSPSNNLLLESDLYEQHSIGKYCRKHILQNNIDFPKKIASSSSSSTGKLMSFDYNLDFDPNSQKIFDLPPPDYNIVVCKKQPNTSSASLRSPTNTSNSYRHKRTSISSNNATDNSSIHSDISASLFTLNSSPKRSKFSEANSINSSSSSSQDKEGQLSQFQMSLDTFQKKINCNWSKRSNDFWQSINDKVSAIVFTDSAVCLQMQGIYQSTILSWFKQNAVHYVACVEKLGTELNKSPWINEEVTVKSAGTAEHDVIPHNVTDEVFNYFESQLNKGCSDTTSFVTSNPLGTSAPLGSSTPSLLSASSCPPSDLITSTIE